MPKFEQARSRWRLAAWPTGETSPGPCQAVRTPKNSQSAASLRARRQAADVRDVDADEVDQAVADQRHVLVLVDEQLAHRDRDVLVCWRRMLEVADVLRGERVFEEEQLVLLQVLRELDRQDRRDALVDVVQQLDLVAELACGGARRASARSGSRRRGSQGRWSSRESVDCAAARRRFGCDLPPVP